MGNRPNQRPAEIILASASPRRRDLLMQAGLTFEVVTAPVDEAPREGEPPEALAGRLCAEKCRAVAALVKRPAIVIAADTVVALGGVAFGKPANAGHALHMLGALQGKAHSVFTGVAIKDTRARNGNETLFVESADVFMRPLSQSEIRSYVATGEPFGKAGAYAIQGKGALLVEKIHGDYNTVVGLPLTRVCLALRELGVDVMGSWPQLYTLS